MDLIRKISKRGGFFKLAGGAFGIRILGMGAAYATNVLVARLSGTEAYGQYVFLISMLLLLSVPGKFGFEAATLRFASAYVTEQRWRDYKRFFRISLIYPLLAGTLVATIWFLAVHNYFLNEKKIPLHYTALLAAIVPLHCAINVLKSHLRAHKQIVAALVPPSIVLYVVVALSSYLVYHFRGSLTADTILLAYLGATLVCALMYSVGLFKRWPRGEITDSASPTPKGEWLRTAFSMLFSTGFVVIMRQADILLIGFLTDLKSAGIYGAVTRIGRLTTLGFNASNFVVAPMISSAYAAADMVRLRKVVGKACWFILVFTIPNCLVLLVGGPWLLGMFGGDFRSAYPALVIILAGQMVNALTGCVEFLMNMTYLEKQAAVIQGLTLCSSVIIGLILIPRIGINGAAIASSCGMVLSNLTMLYMVVTRLGVNPSVLGLFTRKRTDETA